MGRWGSGVLNVWGGEGDGLQWQDQVMGVLWFTLATVVGFAGILVRGQHRAGWARIIPLMGGLVQVLDLMTMWRSGVVAFKIARAVRRRKAHAGAEPAKKSE